MNKNSPTIKEKIKQVNHLLVDYFGIPFRPKKLPDPVDALIATILSQNTNDKNSYQAYLNLKQKYKHWNKLSDVSRAEIEKTIKVAGLGKQKSASIKSFLKTLKKKNGRLDLQYIKKMADLSHLHSAGRSINGRHQPYPVARRGDLHLSRKRHVASAYKWRSSEPFPAKSYPTQV